MEKYFLILSFLFLSSLAAGNTITRGPQIFSPDRDGIYSNNDTLIIKNCRIKSFDDLKNKLDTAVLKTEPRDSADTVYTIFKALEFVNCTVDLSLDNKRATPAGRLYRGKKSSNKSIVFKNKVSFHQVKADSFYLQNATFDSACEFQLACDTCRKGSEAIIFKTTFNNAVAISSVYDSENSRKDPKSIVEYDRRATYNDNPLCNMIFTSSKFKGLLKMRSSVLKNMKFKNTTFDAPFILSNKTIDSTLFEKCNFKDIVDLRGVQVTNGSQFKDSYFGDSVNIVIATTDELDKLDLSVMSLQKVFIIIDWNWGKPLNQYLCWNTAEKRFSVRSLGRESRIKGPGDAKQMLPDFEKADLDQVKDKFQKIKENLSKTVINDDMFGSSKQKIVSWLDYQQKQYEKLYYGAIIKGNLLNNITNWGIYCRLVILEKIVNFGYKGEKKFFMWCLAIIFAFSLFYRVRHVKEIEAYINDEPVKETDIALVKTHEFVKRLKSTFFNIDFTKTFFASFAIFINPKFPFKAYKYSNEFCRVVIIEWILGMSFILLFLYFIAGKYPILTKLLGF